MLATVCTKTNSQELLIPYRVGEKFGLSDLGGNLVVAPQFDKVDLLANNFFSCTDDNDQMEEVKNFSGKTERIKRKHPVNRLYRGSELLIDSAQFDTFFVKGELIYNSRNFTRPEDFWLYNHQGELLIDRPIKNIFFNDKRYVGSFISPDPDKLIVCLEEDNRQRGISMAIYDWNKKDFTQWLFVNSLSFNFNKSETSYSHLLCTYTDESRIIRTEYLVYNSATNLFEFVREKPEEIAKEKYLKKYYELKAELEKIERAEVNKALEELDKNSNSKQEKEEYRGEFGYFLLKEGNKLYYDLNLVDTPEDYEFKLKKASSKTQVQPVIFESKGKYGLIKSWKSQTPAMYESLSYASNGVYIDGELKQRYFAGNQSPPEDSWKFNILDENGEELYSTPFDSILFRYPEFSVNYNTEPRKFEVKRPSGYKKWTPNSSYVFFENKEQIICHYNGKYGIIDLKGNSLIPAEYDHIWKTELSTFSDLSYYASMNVEFLILQKGEKFGVYASANKRSEPISLDAIFDYPAGCIFTNYCGQENVHIVKLYNSSGFYAYANADGVKYYQEE